MADLQDRGRALEDDYFRRKEQELVEKMKAKIAGDKAKDIHVKCPKCDGTLHETEYESIKIDVCDNCTGVWLDAGELAQIAHKDEQQDGWFGRLFS